MSRFKEIKAKYKYSRSMVPKGETTVGDIDWLINKIEKLEVELKAVKWSNIKNTKIGVYR